MTIIIEQILAGAAAGGAVVGGAVYGYLQRKAKNVSEEELEVIFINVMAAVADGNLSKDELKEVISGIFLAAKN
ncbi:MAG: hypothetical protein M0R51_16745 [Clostridia bacterium]|jgi:hypothetical protein|nr:hypothetical protein [Clostridia bacterium]